MTRLSLKHRPFFGRTTLWQVALAPYAALHLYLLYIFWATLRCKHSSTESRPSAITPSSKSNLLFSVNTNHGICLKNLSLRFCRFLSVSQPELQPAVLACLAESTSLLLKAMNLKRQHVVGTTLGGGHTHSLSHTRLLLKPCSYFFSKVLQKASKRSNNCGG